MNLTQEQWSILDRWITGLAGKIVLWGLGALGLTFAALVPESWSMKIALAVIAILVGACLWLTVRYLRLARSINELKKPQQKTRTEPDCYKQSELSEEAFSILCWIFAENGKVTDERIMAKIKISQPEVELHISRLYDKCYISYPDPLYDPPGYKIIPDGTAYVLKYRRKI